MAVYTGPVEDCAALIQFFRRENRKMRSLRKVVISRDKTVVWDVNRDSVEFPGLTFGSPVLDALLEELNVVYNPKMLEDGAAAGVKEFELSARFPWGEDRVM